MVADGATRFPMIALSVIVTVAPGPKSGPGGTSIPPPEANAPVTTVNLAANGLVRDTPPVMVTPDMETVGRAASPNVPIVITGPPPRIVVAGGEVVAEDGVFLGRETPARFLPRPRRTAAGAGLDPSGDGLAAAR